MPKWILLKMFYSLNTLERFTFFKLYRRQAFKNAIDVRKPIVIETIWNYFGKKHAKINIAEIKKKKRGILSSKKSKQFFNIEMYRYWLFCLAIRYFFTIKKWHLFIYNPKIWIRLKEYSYWRIQKKKKSLCNSRLHCFYHPVMKLKK